MEQVYGRTTIEELLDDTDPVRSLCTSAAEPVRDGTKP